MTLKEKLEAQLERGRQRMGPENMAIIKRGNEELLNSGIVENILPVGEKAPDFTLKNQDGVDVSLATLRAKGPVVINVYRGKW